MIEVGLCSSREGKGGKPDSDWNFEGWNFENDILYKFCFIFL